MAEEEQLGFSLAAPASTWPDASRFPRNFGPETVGGRVRRDLLASGFPLMVTGYAGIEELLGFVHAWNSKWRGRNGRIQLLVGVEPTLRDVGRARDPMAVEHEVREYWLRRGISLMNSQELLTTIELLEAGRIEARISGATRIHAKVYASEASVTLGSSNFTRPGLESNLEANARFQRDMEPERFAEATALAETLWSEGRDYTAALADLLDRLLRKVTWQEALGRACAELLEGDWAPDHVEGASGVARLWPSQKQGITQALWVLENHGAVLVADATGSGKTRMGAHLLKAVQDRHWRMGRGRKRYPVMVCPPGVRPLWESELAGAAEAVEVVSHGRMSRRDSHNFERTKTGLRSTQLLGVDEAHNFLNRSSNRSQLLYGNVADNVVLFTATPINRGAQDLLSIVELLGADHFEDEVLDVVGRLATRRRKGGRALGDAETERIRSALQEFVVRRTKADFNRLIDREPEAYVNALGDRCRYPEHDAVVFPREDPRADRSRAHAIREKARNLRGLINLQGAIRMPAFLGWEGWSEDRFLKMRIRGARALATYHLRSRLRSSKAALVEHVLGTREAGRRFDIEGAKQSKTGNIIETLEGLSGRPPRIQLDAEAPSWLTDPEDHRLAVEEEIATYRDILHQAEQMSQHRAEANADYLAALLDDNRRVLAFDSHPISLHDLRRRLEARGISVALATGAGSEAARRDFMRTFALGSSAEGVVGLCSDALAEGINLQGASALVHLDLPSVIRVLEQRIGRLDRMDSPHQRVAVHWPQEPPEFQLRADERLFWRLQAVDDLLGSNVPIPEGFDSYRPDDDALVEVGEIIEAVEGEEAKLDEATLADAFSTVRGLVYGADAVVDPGVYKVIRTSKQRVLSSVAVVPASDRPWAFLAIGSSDRTVPRWVLVEGERPSRVTGSLDEVARQVRERVVAHPTDLPFEAHAAEVLEGAVRAAERYQVELLPRRKRRALDELQAVLGHYERQAAKDGAGDRLRLIRHVLALVKQATDDLTVDPALLAEWWLEVIRPEWQEHLASPGIRRPARLKHIRKKLRDEPVSTERLATVRERDFTIEPLERRVVAAIVGVNA